ncbi:yippee family protein [Nannizzia gypsea CBS 118893]|uniref:Yippee family protein n=1 Tax=Arthroderma gypseum (strain ATCC MYA-4604 / CBS 118893) TaxID=535722 RepID=E5QZ05_ARTGP|nr:yippee family protein [Nannizzia gypsea CBS 118893]EFQ98914.1 yippee family protein [Nannizzia gypsea CBS 118893]
MAARFPSYLQGDEQESTLRCTNCAASICLASQVISKGFTGRHGRAYLIADPKAPHPALSVLANTVAHRAVPRQLVTGSHTVSDIACRFCHTVLGWKYLAAEEESQKYKVGKFIVESKRVSLSRDGPVDFSHVAAAAAAAVAGGSGKKEEVEFDSQDEDECEDLFAGVWTPSLAAKRRQRRKHKS